MTVVFSWVTLLSSFFLSQATIDCDEAFQCESRIIRNVTSITASGYKSVWKSLITDGDSIQLLGSYSGYRSELLHSASTIVSQGSLSMSKCDFIANSGTILCQASFDCGENPLMNSLNNGTIYCNGDSSCMNSKIDSTNTIYGNGAFSLQNSQISTNNIVLTDNNEMNVYFYGYYSGYGTNITCLDGYKCNIYCGDYSCIDNMILNCLDNNDNNCNIYCLNGNNDEECIFNQNSTSKVDVSPDYVPSLITSNNKICDENVDADIINNNSIVYDDGNENGDSIVNTLYLSGDDIVYTLCFRGYQSGILSNITIDNSSHVLSCDGGKSCANADITTVNDVGHFQSTFLCSGMLCCALFEFIFLRFRVEKQKSTKMNECS